MPDQQIERWRDPQEVIRLAEPYYMKGLPYRNINHGIGVGLHGAQIALEAQKRGVTDIDPDIVAAEGICHDISSHLVPGKDHKKFETREAYSAEIGLWVVGNLGMPNVLKPDFVRDIKSTHLPVQPTTNNGRALKRGDLWNLQGFPVQLLGTTFALFKEKLLLENGEESVEALAENRSNTRRDFGSFAATNYEPLREALTPDLTIGDEPTNKSGHCEFVYKARQGIELLRPAVLERVLPSLMPAIVAYQPPVYRFPAKRQAAA